MDLEILKVAKTLTGDDREKFIALYDERKRLASVGILLALLLGGFGAHLFYLNKTQKGIWYLVASLVGVATSFIGVGVIALLVVTILCIIDAVNMQPSVKIYNRKAADDLRKEIEFMRE